MNWVEEEYSVGIREAMTCMSEWPELRQGTW